MPTITLLSQTQPLVLCVSFFCILCAFNIVFLLTKVFRLSVIHICIHYLVSQDRKAKCQGHSMAKCGLKTSFCHLRTMCYLPTCSLNSFCCFFPLFGLFFSTYTWIILVNLYVPTKHSTHHSFYCISHEICQKQIAIAET